MARAAFVMLIMGILFVSDTWDGLVNMRLVKDVGCLKYGRDKSLCLIFAVAVTLLQLLARPMAGWTQIDALLYSPTLVLYYSLVL